MTTDSPILEIRPSWWRFFWHLVFCWLIVPLVVAFIKRNSLVLRVYGDRLNLEMGWLSKRIVDIYIADIRTIEVKQSFWQRMLNIGRLEVDTAKDDAMIGRRGTHRHQHFGAGVQPYARRADRVLESSLTDHAGV